MPRLKTYDLFLSHVWRQQDNGEYYRLESLLSAARYFSWRNYSVPEHDPLGVRSNHALEIALDRQIRPVNCFLLVSGMYVNNRRWIQTEIDIALRYEKPIIGIVRLGQQRVPVHVQGIASEMVGWRANSIVHAVRRWAL